MCINTLCCSRIFRDKLFVTIINILHVVMCTYYEYNDIFLIFVGTKHTLSYYTRENYDIIKLTLAIDIGYKSLFGKLEVLI